MILLLLLAQEATYHFGAADERTNVSFESKTGVMTIVGTTHKITGSVTFDPKAGTGQAKLVVPVDSLNTGLPARDRVIRMQTWLDAKAHPALEFAAKKGAFHAPTAWKIEGEFTMRGVARPLALDCDVREISDALAQKFKLGAGRWIRVKTRFTLKLSDFGIKVPDQSIAQVSDAWTVAVEIYGTTEKPAAEPPKPRDDDAPDKVYKTREIALDAPGARWRFGMKPQHTSIAAWSGTDASAVTVTGVTMSGLAAIDGDKGALKLSVPVESLSTGIEKLDAALHAKLGAFIDFESTRAAPGRDGWEIEGNLTLNGRSRAISVKVATQEISAEVARKQKWGDQPGLKFTATIALKLADFGVEWHDPWTVQIDAVAMAER